MADHRYTSDLEKTNLEAHVVMERQRYLAISEKVETLDERINALIDELSKLRQENLDAFVKLRHEIVENSNATNKIFVGAAATIIGGLLSTIIVILVALL